MINLGISMETEGCCKQHTTAVKNAQIKYSGEMVYVCIFFHKMTELTETEK